MERFRPNRMLSLSFCVLCGLETCVRLLRGVFVGFFFKLKSLTCINY
jgi:hypothetical protein